jgi:hypothetical protein
VSAPGPDATAELVKLARQLERQLARRRTITRKLAVLDAEITTTRRFLRDMTRPFEPLEFEWPCWCNRTDKPHQFQTPEVCTADSPVPRP